MLSVKSFFPDAFWYFLSECRIAWVDFNRKWSFEGFNDLQGAGFTLRSLLNSKRRIKWQKFRVFKNILLKFRHEKGDRSCRLSYLPSKLLWTFNKTLKPRNLNQKDPPTTSQVKNLFFHNFNADLQFSKQWWIAKICEFSHLINTLNGL